jgi:hypothetical protein
LWLILGLLIWPAYWLTRDWNWAALLLTIFAVGFFSSASFFTLVLAFTMILGICWLAFLRLRRMKIKLKHFMYTLAGISAFFTLYVLVLGTTMLTRIPWARYKYSLDNARNYSLSTLSSPPDKPDIYYIVLDGYVRSDILQEMFGFDNSEFIKDLREKGFIVPASNHSNYPVTPLSVSSTLNMDYIQAFVSGLDNSSQHWLMAPFIDHSRVRSLLESQG